MGKPSKLQEFAAQQLYRELPHLTIKENYWPEWLQNPNGGFLELDFYLPEIRTAIEIQGRQHYEYVPHFHGNYDGFLAQLKRDQIKRDTCAIEKIKLVEIDNRQDLLLFIKSIKENDKPLPRFFSYTIKDKPRRIKRLEAKIDRMQKRVDYLSAESLRCNDSDKTERMTFERDNILKKFPKLIKRIEPYNHLK